MADVQTVLLYILLMIFFSAPKGLGGNDLRDDLAAKVHSYRVTANQYSLNREE